MSTLARYRKSLAAFTPAVVLLIGAWFVTSPHAVTDAEWGAILTALVAGPPVVAAAPANKPKPPKR